PHVGSSRPGRRVCRISRIDPGTVRDSSSETMRYPGFHFLWVPFVLACQPSGEGLGTESEGPTSSGSGTTMAETAPATTSEGTTEGVDGSATSSGSGPATGSSGGSGTDDGPGTSSGPGEESSSGGDPPGPGAGEPYGPCDEGACTGEGVVCWADHPGFDMCLPPCDGTNPSCP